MLRCALAPWPSPRTPSAPRLCALALGLALVACGDRGDTEPSDSGDAGADSGDPDVDGGGGDDGGEGIDADGDGWDAGEDCDDGDPEVNPDAEEICDNGVDDDCDGTANGCGFEDMTLTASDGVARIDGFDRSYEGGNSGFVGDVDGDGHDDMLFGAFSANVEGMEGRAWLVHGGGTGVMRLDNDAHAWWVDGSVGIAWEGLGDVDGDGYDDFALAAAAGSGWAGIVHGPASAGQHASMTGLPAVVGGEAGAALQRLADVDGDGLPDLAVGAPAASSGAGGHGAVVLLSGDIEGELDVDTIEPIVWGEEVAAGFGSAIGAGDFDGDGVDDLAVGAPYSACSAAGSGAVIVLFGPVSGSLGTSDADATLCGDDASGNLGFWVQGEADLDEDGYTELAATVLHADGGKGEVRIWSGGVAGPDLESPTARIQGQTTFWGLGEGLEAIVDLEADGSDAFFVGASGADVNDVHSGQGALVLGPVSGVLGDDDLITFTGESTYTGVGARGSAGDWDGDGVKDLAIGATYSSLGMTWSGSTWILPGVGW